METIVGKAKKKTPEKVEDKLLKSADGWFLAEPFLYILKNMRKQWKPCTIAGMHTYAVKIVPHGYTRNYWASVRTGTLYDTKTLKSVGGKLKIKWGHK